MVDELRHRGGIAVVAHLLLPEKYAIAGALGGTPFIVIGAIAAWRQLRAPSTARVTSTLEAVGAMSWRDFSNALEDAFRRDGYAVTRLPGGQADLELDKAGRTSLVSCKRWKAASTGSSRCATSLGPGTRARRRRASTSRSAGSPTTPGGSRPRTGSASSMEPSSRRCCATSRARKKRARAETDDAPAPSSPRPCAGLLLADAHAQAPGTPTASGTPIRTREGRASGRGSGSSSARACRSRPRAAGTCRR